MEIVVLVKPLPQDPTKSADAIGTGPTQDTPQRLNPPDRAPLRIAQGLKAAHDATIHLVALGPPSATAALQDALALAGDHAHLVTGDDVTGGDAWANAHALEALLRKIGSPPLVLAGTRSQGQGTGHTGPRTAILLDRPLIHRASTLTLDEDTLHATVTTRYRQDELSTPLPALATIAPHARPNLDTPHHHAQRTRLDHAQRDRTLDDALHEHTLQELTIHENLVGWRGSPTLTLDTTPRETIQREARHVDASDEDALATLADEIRPGGTPR